MGWRYVGQNFCTLLKPSLPYKQGCYQFNMLIAIPKVTTKKMYRKEGNQNGTLQKNQIQYNAVIEELKNKQHIRHVDNR